MSATILSFSPVDTGNIVHSPTQTLEQKAHLARMSQAFARRVDYNIRGVSGIGYEFFSKILLAIFRSIIASQGRYTDGDTILRAEYQIQNCTIFDCARIIHEVDGYLQRIHVQESPEKDFFMYVRNIAFSRKNMLAQEGREK